MIDLSNLTDTLLDIYRTEDDTDYKIVRWDSGTNKYEEVGGVEVDDESGEVKIK